MLDGSSIISFNLKLQSNHKIVENNFIYNPVLFSKTIFILFDTWWHLELTLVKKGIILSGSLLSFLSNLSNKDDIWEKKIILRFFNFKYCRTITLAWVLPVMDLIVYRNDEANFRSAKLSSVSSKYNYHFLLLIGYKSLPATTIYIFKQARTVNVKDR